MHTKHGCRFTLVVLLTATLIKSGDAQDSGQPANAVAPPRVSRVGPETRPQLKKQPVLMPALRAAEHAYQYLDRQVDNYSCVFVKQERVKGKLGSREQMYCRIRHQTPERGFGAYAYYLAPHNVKGRQVLFVAGENDNKMLAREARGLSTVLGVVSLDPRSRLAMARSRYPITDIGIKNLCKKMVLQLRRELPLPGSELRIRTEGKVMGRPVLCYEIRHPKKKPGFQAHLARIFYDREWPIPIRYEAYDWPTSAEATPALIEEYTYVNLKFNQPIKPNEFSRQRLK